MSGMKSAVHVSEKNRIAGKDSDVFARENTKEFLTVYIGKQIFGIPVLQVQDVLSKQSVTKVPLAPKEVAGSLNLRGRIVTAIDVRINLGVDPEKEGQSMSIVVEHKDELYSLIVDRVGDVLPLSDDIFEKSPATLDSKWKDVSAGVYRLDKELMVVLDVSRLLGSICETEGALNFA